MRPPEDHHVHIRSRLDTLEIGQCKALADAIAIGAARDLPDRRPVRQEDRLAASGVGALNLKHFDQPQDFTWCISFERQVCGFMQEILVELDQALKPCLLRPILRRIFAAPASIALLDPKRHERTAADSPSLKRLGGLDQCGIDGSLIALVAIDLPTEIAGERDTQGAAFNAGNLQPPRPHEGPGFV